MNRNHITDTFALSPMQQGMLFHHLKEPHSGVDIEQLVIHLPEEVDLVRLQAAWQWLVGRHDILRTQFIWESVEEPQQRVLAEVIVPVIYQDASGLAEVHQHERLRTFLELDRLRGFELDCAPLLRLTLFQWSEALFSLVWTFHHAILDGRSFPTLLREVFEAYEELAEGQISIRPVPPSYRRYIEWLKGQSFVAAESFWKERLKTFSTPTPLVVDRRVSSDEDVYQQGEAWQHVDPATTLELRRLAKAHDLSVNSLVMSAWAILLHRYSGEEDVVFGATRACRKSSIAGADETVGIFINTVPVRVQLRGDQSALSILQSVRQTWIDIRPYEHTPLALVHAASKIPPAQPLFETLLVFENVRLDRAMHSLGGAWSARTVELHELTNFPITLAAYDGDELSLKIEFNRRRLDETAVEHLLGHFIRLLGGIAANPESKVRDLPLLTEPERKELTEKFNTPIENSISSVLPLESGATLYELFEAQVARRPEAVALISEGESLTYNRLNAQANRLAHELVRWDIKPDMLVGLCLERSHLLVVAILAILKAGGAYLPIDLAYPADRLIFMLEDAQAPLLLTETKLANNLPPTQAKILFVDDILAQPVSGEEEMNLIPLAGPDHLAYVIYTSGTTGKPKGSLITHRNVVRLFPATEHWYGFNEHDVWTLFHSSAFDFSVWEIWGALLYGGRLVVVPFMVSRSPESFYELLVREQVTVLNQTPSAFRQLIQAEEAVGQKDLSLRYVIFGGEALEMQSLRPWFDRHGDQTPRLVNMYGITETTVHVTYRPLSKSDLESGSVIGVPIPDLQIYILDSQLQPVPIGVPGEMYVGGAGLARGYLRRPELTAERFIPNRLTNRPESRLYRTGDLARFLPDRDIEYLGRIDNQVKIRGFRIELGEIESILCQHAAVREAKVIAREDVPGSKRLVAYLIALEPPPDISALREHLKQKLPEYMVPAAFVFLSRLPLTTNGKIDQKALPVPEHRPELSGRYLAPRTQSEKTLAAIWSKVLRVQQVGVNDNFFELGGDSILSIQVISMARRAGLKLTPKLLFAHQTIGELATVAIVADDARPAQEIIGGDLPLTPIQHWFFEQNLDELQHYNQAFLFEVAERMDHPILEDALNQLVLQHDALRLRYIHEASGWRQFYSDSQEPAPLTWTIVQEEEDELQQTIENVAARSQASLNVETGPLWRAAYFELGSGLSDRLLIVVHHLAVDGISWRPLLEDLETAYQQLKARQEIQLPAKTTSFKTWAERLRQFAEAGLLRNELPYWKRATHPQYLGEAMKPLMMSEAPVENTEGSASTLKVSLSAEETQALLQQVPAAYNTQINDVLLTALTRAWHRWSGSRVIFTNLEGHGRENLFEDLDLSRTAGWFTSIFPVRLELPEAGIDWQPGEALKSVKEQLRQIPHRGIGYGILRYLSSDADLCGVCEPPMVFNYLGQFDQVIAGSKLFRFAHESTGPWHSPKHLRRYVLEANSLVIDGRLELWWTYDRKFHSVIRQLAEEFLAALKELIVHCQAPLAGGRTPSDFPLARLDQPALDRLVPARSDIEDIYPLSPIQTLFFSSNPGVVHSTFDQWHCTLHGEVNVSAFQRAWKETLQRHTILRSTIHGDGLREPLQMVHRDVQVPWTIEDWRGLAADQREGRWPEYLDQERVQPLNLTQAPVMRFTLARLPGDTWKFLWCVPALLLDGWSWPLVFRDASRLYEAFTTNVLPQLEPVRPYRDYLDWLGKQSFEEAEQFWRNNLAGFREPTPLVTELPASDTTGKRYLEHTVQFSAEATNALQSAARRLQVTPNTLLQGAWALLLAQRSGGTDVVFGAAFSGRPADLQAVESIVGPFVNTLPVRVTVSQDANIGDLLQELHAQLLQLNSFQFLPLMDIQRCSEMPWRHRLFDSLIVFQNYLVDDSARRFGSQVEITDFVGPIHTNYPILLMVEPGQALQLTLICDQRIVTHAAAEKWGRDLSMLLELIPAFLERRASELQALLSPRQPALVKRRLRVESQTFVPPQTGMEQTIAGVWQKMFGLERISIEENFFDLGGHSLLLVQMHSRLQETLKSDFPIVKVFEYPTVRSLARHLGQSDIQKIQTGEQWHNRAQRQKQALAQLRIRLKK